MYKGMFAIVSFDAGLVCSCVNRDVLRELGLIFIKPLANFGALLLSD